MGIGTGPFHEPKETRTVSAREVGFGLERAFGLVLTIFGPIFASFLASLEKLGRRRTQERSHGRKMAGIVELGGFGCVDVKKRVRLEQTPRLTPMDVLERWKNGGPRSPYQ